MRFVLLILFFITKAFAIDFAELDRFIETAREQRQVPGVAVAVVQNDKVVFLKGFGVIQLGGSEKVDGNTIFQLASITKTFTAAGLAVLVDRKMLTWDDELINHLPQFALKDPYASRYATARDLLAHRTALPTFCGDIFDKLGYTRNEILYRVRFIDPATSFRNRAYYSNIGFFIAGELLAKLSKSSWEEAMQKLVFSPLHLTRTGFSENLDNANVASAHAFIDGKMEVVPWNRLQSLAAAGGITSTAADMAKWMRMFLSPKNKILKPETIEEMFKPSMVAKIAPSDVAPISNSSGFNFGLGWDSYNYLGFRIVEKGGSLEGVRTITTLIPELGIGITVLSNLSFSFLPEAIRAKLLEMAIGKSESDLQAKIVAQEKQFQARMKQNIKPQNGYPLPQDLNQYTGVFQNQLYGDFTIELKDKGLVLKAGPAAWEGNLTHFSNNTFLLTWYGVHRSSQVTFTLGPDDLAIAFETEGLGTFQRKER